jgi:hypothetical protein
MDRIQTILAKVGYYNQCVGSIISESRSGSGSRYLAESGSGFQAVASPDLIRIRFLIQTRIFYDKIFEKFTID